MGNINWVLFTRSIWGLLEKVLGCPRLSRGHTLWFREKLPLSELRWDGRCCSTIPHTQDVRLSLPVQASGWPGHLQPPSFPYPTTVKLLLSLTPLPSSPHKCPGASTGPACALLHGEVPGPRMYVIPYGGRGSMGPEQRNDGFSGSKLTGSQGC